MSLTLHPRAAPPGCLQVWLGAFGGTAAPQIDWRLDGAPREPDLLRPLRSARGAGMTAAATPRAFTGVFQFNGLEVGSVHRIEARSSEGESATLEAHVLPDAVPSGDARFNVLLVSCFHYARDRRGFAGNLVARLPARYRPDLTVLMGDQVYLDLPPIQDFPDRLTWLAEKFERDYEHNWRGPLGYAQILHRAPSVSIPDDHEYWNNFPHASPFIQNSWTAEGRDRWRSAARAMYEAFQLPYPSGFDRLVELDVAPLSFFFMDGRTFRDSGRREAVRPEWRRQFGDWTRRVADRGDIGVVVTGQSLFDEPARRLSGAVGDWALASYGDFGETVQALERLAAGRRPVLCLTGDVHWGRILEARDGTSGRAGLYEVISSPSSLVSTPVQDQLRGIGAAVAGLFGKREPWPRHSPPDDAPAFFARETLGRRFACRSLHGQRGNQVVVLSFRRKGFGLELEVTYWPVYEAWTVPQPIRVGPLRLASA